MNADKRGLFDLIAGRPSGGGENLRPILNLARWLSSHKQTNNMVLALEGANRIFGKYSFEGGAGE